MNKLNNKGFTLVEVLSVVVILGIIMTIMVPNVSTLLDKNKKNNIEHLNASIISAAKMYISDYKYKISLIGTCSDDSDTLGISKIGGEDISNNRIKIEILVSEGNLKTDNNDDIFNPLNKEEKLDKDNSYIEVLYDCATKDYKYNTPSLVWE